MGFSAGPVCQKECREAKNIFLCITTLVAVASNSLRLGGEVRKKFAAEAIASGMQVALLEASRR